MYPGQQQHGIVVVTVVTVTVDEVHGAVCWDTVTVDWFECTGHSG